MTGKKKKAWLSIIHILCLQIDSGGQWSIPDGNRAKEKVLPSNPDCVKQENLSLTVHLVLNLCV